MIALILLCIFFSPVFVAGNFLMHNVIKQLTPEENNRRKIANSKSNSSLMWTGTVVVIFCVNGYFATTAKSTPSLIIFTAVAALLTVTFLIMGIRLRIRSYRFYQTENLPDNFLQRIKVVYIITYLALFVSIIGGISIGLFSNERRLFLYSFNI